ncbi:TPA: RES family NAD+ phosphorylase [Pseudomonas aeruginosa]|nr:RES family NAD+ phosphorylase [Pseudomonas aeruginosa]
MTLDDCESIFNEALKCTTEAQFCHAIAPLWDHYEILSVELGRGSVYWRGRTYSDNHYNSVSELKYPPAHLAGLGRLNDKGTPLFYAATSKETALAEIYATDGQKVQLAGFRVLVDKTLRLALIGEYSHVQKTGYIRLAGRDPDNTILRLLNNLPTHEAQKKIYIDKFFAHILSDPNAKNNDYMKSRALAAMVHSKHKFDGIAFPSVQDLGGYNIAVKPESYDQKLHNNCCAIIEVDRARSFPMTTFKIKNTAQQLDEDENFVWHKEQVDEIIGMYNMTEEEFEAAQASVGDRNSMLHVTSHYSKKYK